MKSDSLSQREAITFPYIGPIRLTGPINAGSPASPDLQSGVFETIIKGLVLI